MTFDEAHDWLNNGSADLVAVEMEAWHPVVLGEMLRAVALAKAHRYPGSHPDYTEALERIARDAGVAVIHR